MDKEHIKKIIKNLYNDVYDSKSGIGKTGLNAINKYIYELEEKIDKIMKYIEENNSEEVNGADYFIIKSYFDNILLILKGEKK